MIKLSEQEKMLFVKNRIEQAFDFSSFEIVNPNLDKITLSMFNGFLELSEIKNIQKWFETVNIPNTKVEDFKERIIETKSGKVLIGIRFLGMDISKPFVDVWASFPIEKELENIVAICKQEFEVFTPKHIRFWVNPNSKFGKAFQKYICQSYLVGDIQKIVSSPKPINYENIDLETVTNLNIYDWYTKIHQEFHKDFPDLKSYVMPNSKEIMEDSIKQNLCYLIKYKGEKIGLIAAEKDDYFGVSSMYMNEIIISKAFKGKKLATAAQRKLIELNKDDFKYIWGSIDQKNIPSTKNALRVGRKKISSEILLPIS